MTQETKPELFSAAMALKIHCPAAPQKSFWTKLEWKIVLELPRTPEHPPTGWKRVQNFGQGASHGYFSRSGIDEEPTWRDVTDHLLVWSKADNDQIFPQVFELGRQTLELFKQIRLRSFDEHIISLSLDSVDLIPLRNWTQAIVGLVLRGEGPVSLRHYLDWVSRRGSFDELALLTPKQVAQGVLSTERGLAAASIGALIAAVRNSLSHNVPLLFPGPPEAGPAPRIGAPSSIFQHVLVPVSQEAWDEGMSSPAWQHGWNLIRTLSRPNPSYPKPSEVKPRAWSTPQGLASNYSVGSNTVAILASADAKLEFNWATKAKVLTCPYYLQYIIVREMYKLRRPGQDTRGALDSLSSFFDPTYGPRISYWKHLVGFFDSLLNETQGRETEHLRREVSEVEVGLRREINSTLNGQGPLVPSHILRKVNEFINDEQRKNAAFDISLCKTLLGMLAYFDLRELQATITSKALWNSFEPRFRNKETLNIKFDQLAAIRNPLAHNRDVDDVTRKEGEAAVLWFKQVLAK